MSELSQGTAPLCLMIACLAVWAPSEYASAEEAGPTVRIDDGFTAAAVRSAVKGAARRLRRASCQRLLAEFVDAAGHTLQANLDARGLTALDQLQSIDFEDGVSRPLCDKTGIHAVTRPGIAVVYICGGAFVAAHQRNSYLAESYIIHELLHTLGLGENPPKSQEITDRVNVACRN
jgi:hypothetical protein